MKKKLFITGLILLLVVTIMLVLIACGGVGGLTDKKGGEVEIATGFIGQLQGEGYCITKYTGAEKEIVIPSTYNNSPVVGIGYLAFNEADITSVVVPDSVEYISDNAFLDCAGLTSLTVGLGLRSIGNNAFSGCSALSSIYYTGDMASWCEKAMLYNLMPYGTSNKEFYINEVKIDGELVISSNVKSISHSAFRECDSLTSVTIQEGVTFIGAYAFANCSALTSITIPSSVTSIGNFAFSGCSALTSVTIPSSVTEILSGAFADCTSLNYITFESGCQLAKIEDGVFERCSNLGSITIPEGVKTIGDKAFQNCSDLASITIPASVTAIAGWAFRGCKHLSSIYYEGDVAGWLEINDLEALMGYTNYGEPNFSKTLYIDGKKTEDLVITDGVVYIKPEAFSHCTSLTSVSICSSVTSIGGRAFQNCSNLTSVLIPNSVTSIGSYAFSGCRNLTSITFQGTKGQWEAISKDFSWNEATGNYTVHCTDGDVAKA